MKNRGFCFYVGSGGVVSVLVLFSSSCFFFRRLCHASIRSSRSIIAKKMRANSSMVNRLVLN